MIAFSASAQQGSISGVITDEVVGETLISAYVFVEGTDLAEATDFDGKYTLRITPGTYTIKVTYIGFDEVNDSKSPSFSCDEEYVVTLKIDEYWSKGIYQPMIQESVVVKTACCSDCGGDCDVVTDYNLDSYYDKMARAIGKYLGDSTYYHAFRELAYRVGHYDADFDSEYIKFMDVTADAISEKWLSTRFAYA